MCVRKRFARFLSPRYALVSSPARTRTGKTQTQQTVQLSPTTHGHACTSLDAITCANQDGDLVAPVEGGHLLGRPVLLRFSFGNRTRLVLPMRAPLDLLRSVSNVLPTSLHRAGNSTRPVGAAQHALITVQS